jgi:hypothetical protein
VGQYSAGADERVYCIDEVARDGVCLLRPPVQSGGKHGGGDKTIDQR